MRLVSTPHASAHSHRLLFIANSIMCNTKYFSSLYTALSSIKKTLTKEKITGGCLNNKRLSYLCDYSALGLHLLNYP